MDHPSLENEPTLPQPAQHVPIVEPDSAPVHEAPNIPAEGAPAAEKQVPLEVEILMVKVAC